VVEPLGPLEAAVLLDRAVDRLQDAGSVHNEFAGAVRETVDTLPLAVLRVDVHDRTLETRFWESKPLQPKGLDIALPLEMIREEVAANSHLFVRNFEAHTQEFQKEREEVRVSVRDSDSVASLVPSAQ
jgi:hypothetical protein